MYKRLSIILCCWLFVLYTSKAQSNIEDTLTFSKVELYPEYVIALPYALQKVDSFLLNTNQSQNLAQVLQQGGLGYVKSYGRNGLATLAYRGGSSSQTALIWNGINLLDPTNGTIDFNLIPAFVIDELYINNSNSNLWGNGAVASALLLNTNPKASPKSIIKATLGQQAYQGYFAGTDIQVKMKNLSISNKSYIKKDLNKFSYNNNTLKDAPLTQNTHGESTSQGTIFDMSFALKKYELTGGYWFHYQHRNIAPRMFELHSFAYQQDESHKGYFKIKKIIPKRKIETYYRASLSNANILYNDTNVNIYGYHQSYQLLNEYSFFKKWQDINLLVNMQWLNQWGKSTHFHRTNLISRPNTSISLNYYNKSRRFSSKIALRKEFVMNTDTIQYVQIPFVPSMGIGYDIKKINLYALTNYTFRLPTFNDLYWYPGGNISLKPEKGWNYEIGIKRNLNPNDKGIWFNLCAYYRKIQDWIVWIPGNNQIYSPENLHEVQSSGIETKIEERYLILSKIESSSSIFFNINNAVQTNSYDNNTLILQKQLIYTPQYQGGYTQQFNYKNMSLHIINQWIGKRYTNAENTKSLAPVFLTDINLCYKKAKVYLQGSIQNILNKNYQMVAYTPMPKRTYQITISYQFI